MNRNKAAAVLLQELRDNIGAKSGFTYVGEIGDDPEGQLGILLSLHLFFSY